MKCGRRSFTFGTMGAMAWFATNRALGSDPVREKLEGPKLDRAISDIALARASVKTLKADFTQERKMALLLTSVKSTGKLLTVTPNRLRWELLPPDDVVYWVGPEGLSYRTRSSKATLPAGGDRVARGLADMRALLGGDLGSLRERYELSGSRSANDIEIAGAAKDKTASVRGFSITLDKGLVVPLSARLLEAKADSIDIAFSNAVVNAPVDLRLMRP
ncbi:MAG: outer membrane lipoprotein carrier protein LolA [Polyangiaceae bacterium]|nr:outer membrane lipoprotein carrier protein LolA [Polyangiaceae bacterium]